MHLSMLFHADQPILYPPSIISRSTTRSEFQNPTKVLHQANNRNNDQSEVMFGKTHHPKIPEMDEKAFPVGTDQDAPAYYEMAIPDPPSIVDKPGGGDNVRIGVIKYSLNRLSKTTVSLVAGVVAVLIIAAAVVLCVLLTRPSQSSQPAAMAMPTQMTTVVVGDGSGYGSGTKGSSHTGTPTLDLVFIARLSGTMTVEVSATSYSGTKPNKDIPSLSKSTVPVVTVSQAIDTTTSSTSESATTSTSAIVASSTTHSTPRCETGFPHSGSTLQRNSSYGVYGLEAMAAVTDPSLTGFRDTNIATLNNTLFVECGTPGDGELVAVAYCSVGVDEGLFYDMCADWTPSSVFNLAEHFFR